MRRITQMRRWLIPAVAAVVLGLPVLVQGMEASGPDAEAMAIFGEMTDYLAGLERFSVQGHGILEVVLVSGQKIQFDNDVMLLVERPNKMLATRRGEAAEQRLYYDGAEVTLFDPELNYYATVSAPPAIDEMLDFAMMELDLVAPGSDLIRSNAFDLLTADMTEGFVVTDRAWIDGEPCRHLAFRKPGVDIQIWIAAGGRPLPLKYVLTTTDMMASPQFMVFLSQWDTSPHVEDGMFGFTPPEDASGIEFFTTGATSN